MSTESPIAATAGGANPTAAQPRASRPPPVQGSEVIVSPGHQPVNRPAESSPPTQTVSPMATT